MTPSKLWTTRLALAPILAKPRHLILYFFLLLTMSISLFLSFELQSRISDELSLHRAELLGGDVEIELGLAPPDEEMIAFLADATSNYTQRIQFRSMVSVADSALPAAHLARVQMIDDHYPLIGAAEFETLLPNHGLHDLLEERDDKFGVLLPPAFAERLGAADGDPIKLMGETLEYRGQIINTPELSSEAEVFLPTILVSTQFMQSIQAEQSGFFRHSILLLLNPGSSAEELELQLKTDFDGIGSRFIKATDNKRQLGLYIETARKIWGLTSALSLIVCAIALFTLITIHINEEKATHKLLSTMGASKNEIAYIYFLRLILTYLLLSAIIFPLISIFAPLIAERSDQFTQARINDAHAINILRSSIKSFLLVGAISIIVGVIAYFRSTKTISLIGIALSFAIGLIVGAYLIPLYLFDIYMLKILGGIIGGVIAYIILFLFIKRALRIFLINKEGRLSALHFLIHKNSKEEYIGSAIFASLILFTFFNMIESQINKTSDDLSRLQLPSHYIGDILPDQKDEFIRLLQSEEIEDYQIIPVASGRILAMNGNTDLPNHWLTKGDHMLSIGDYPPDEELIAQGKWWSSGYTERSLASLDVKLARELGLNVGDHITIGSIGNEFTAEIKSLHFTKLGDRDFRFPLHLNDNARTLLPYRFIASLNVKTDKAPLAFQSISNRFPNIIIITTKTTLKKITGWLMRLKRNLSWIGLHILAITAIYLISTLALNIRRTRYELAIFGALGGSLIEMLKIEWERYALHAAIAIILALPILFYGMRLISNSLLLHSPDHDMGLILYPILTFLAFLFLVTTIITALFSRTPNFNKIQLYAQDFL